MCLTVRIGWVTSLTKPVLCWGGGVGGTVVVTTGTTVLGGGT